MSHRGIDPTDARNAGIVEYFRPKPVTLESIAQKIAAISPGKSRSDIREQARQALERIESNPHRPDPPLSQPVEQAPHPWLGLGTHPDIIEPLWKLDDLLHQRCRWLLWGFPALVRPDSGVVFAAARGTIGIFLRLPPELLASDERAVAQGKAKILDDAAHDIGSAGPEWRFLHSMASLAHYGMIAYSDAGPIKAPRE